MCFFYAQKKSKKELELRFDAFAESDEDIFGDYNAHAYPFASIIANDRPKIITQAQWGLVPPSDVNNIAGFRKKAKTFNARIEGIENRDSFKESIDNRCLVLVSEFYEWKHYGKETCKHRIFTKDELPFAFAGLYNDIGNYKTFTIITTEANELMAGIHNSQRRMPVILRKEEEKLWMHGEPIDNFHERKEVELIAEPLVILPLF